MQDWHAYLRCPRTGNRLVRGTGSWRTEDGICYPEKNGTIYLLDDADEARTMLASADGRSMVKAYREPNPVFQTMRQLISSEYFPGKAWRMAKRRVIEGDLPFLVIGSGTTRYSGAVHLDLDDFPGVDVVADAQRLPFADASMNGVVCEVVLEHVSDPVQVIAETRRVLRPGGRFFFITPFLFPYHGHPGDFRRWSREGLLAEFSAFEDLAVGIHGGPCSSMVNLLSEWFYVLSGFRFPRGYLAFKGLATALLFPLKFLDLAANRFPEAHRLASTLFITGAKPGEPE